MGTSGNDSHSFPRAGTLQPLRRVGFYVNLDEVSLTFDLVQKPLHLGHIVRPGRYRLSIEVAAENFAAIIQQVEINFDGEWNADPQTMVADHLGIKA